MPGNDLNLAEAHAQFSGRRLWYRDAGGKGVPAVFLHARTGSSLVWEQQIAPFAAAGYRFIAYDRLGHCKSALEAGEARWSELEHLSRSKAAPEQPLRKRITFALLETITLPVLLLSGDADLYTPPAVLRLFAARIRNSRSVVVGECGHSAYWEQPEVFNREVLAFLGKH